MITGIIAGLLLIVAVPPSIHNGDWGAAGTAVVLAVILLICGAMGRKEDRAWSNYVHYWATGETPEERWRKPEPKKVYRRKSRAEERQEMEDARRKREKYKASLEHNIRTNGKMEILTCPTCGKRMQTVTKLVTINGEDWLTCRCTKCGAKLSKKK